MITLQDAAASIGRRVRFHPKVGVTSPTGGLDGVITGVSKRHILVLFDDHDTPHQCWPHQLYLGVEDEIGHRVREITFEEL